MNASEINRRRFILSFEVINICGGSSQALITKADNNRVGWSVVIVLLQNCVHTDQQVHGRQLIVLADVIYTLLKAYNKKTVSDYCGLLTVLFHSKNADLRI